MSDIYQQVEIDFDSIHELSLDLIHGMQESGVSPAEATAAMAMTIGRLSSTDKLSPEDEIKFVQQIAEFVAAFFAKGSVN